MTALPPARRTRPRVVIIGGGFAGLNAARIFKRSAVDVTLIDRTNHHVFQPLLYQAATGTVAASDITAPIRYVLRHQRNTRVLLGDVREIDPVRKVVYYDAERREVPYDFLIVAAGSRHSYFGHRDWEAFAPGLKTIDDAMEIRRRFLLAFELAEKTDDPLERDALLTFVIIGGGPTGVELAGLLPEITRKGFRSDFRRIDTARTRVLLVEGGSRVLSNLPESLSARALEDLKQLGVEVRTNSIVTRVERDAVFVGAERMPTRTIFWAAGNVASPLGRWLGVPSDRIDRTGRVMVEPDLSVPGHPEVFVVGDMAKIAREDGTPVPAVAPAATQQGRTAAENILKTLRGAPRQSFRYLNKGDLATIGRYKAVGDFGWFTITGAVAWYLWLFVHIMYLVGFRNRASVLVQWAYAYFTYQRGVRLITHEGGWLPPSELAQQAALAAGQAVESAAPAAAPTRAARQRS